MLNQTENQHSTTLSDWCVGEPPAAWDVSFGARLAEQIRRWFGLANEQPAPTVRMPANKPANVRKAA